MTVSNSPFNLATCTGNTMVSGTNVLLAKLKFSGNKVAIIYENSATTAQIAIGDLTTSQCFDSTHSDSFWKGHTDIVVGLNGTTAGN
jgi:hypothetical protein